jgi:hypothetical protein
MNDAIQLDQVRQLEVAERDGARKKAIDLSIPKRREVKDFEQQSYSKFPEEAINAITVACFVLLGVFFLPSAIRVFQIASETYALSITNEQIRPIVATIAGACIVLGAEIAVIIFSLAAVLLPLPTIVGKREWGRVLLTIMTLLSGAIALVGNVQVAFFPTSGTSAAVTVRVAVTPFGILEALAPPIAVLGTSYVLKLILLAKAETRHQARRKYEEYEKQRRDYIAEPEKIPGFQMRRIQCLREAIVSANAKRFGKANLQNELSDSQWSFLVDRELRAENWYKPTPEGAFNGANPSLQPGPSEEIAQ